MSGPQMFMVLVLYVLGLGVFLRKRRAIHAFLMGIAICADLGLTTYLEISRKVIEVSVDSASGFQGNRSLLVVHILIALALLLTYPILAWTGARMLRSSAQREKYSRWKLVHGKVAVVTFTLYFLSFVTAPNSVIERLCF